MIMYHILNLLTGEYIYIYIPILRISLMIMNCKFEKYSNYPDDTWK